MSEKKRIVRYMRVGNEEQAQLSKSDQARLCREFAQENGIQLMPPHSDLNMKKQFDKAVAEGATPITLPKKKAWLFMRESIATTYEERHRKTEMLRNHAETHRYDIVGETVVLGRTDQSKIAIEHLLNGELQAKGVDVLLIRSLRDFSFKCDEVLELYDMIKDNGFEVDAIDGSIEGLESQTENGIKWREVFAQIANSYDTDQEEGETPTLTMGGGMQ